VSNKRLEGDANKRYYNKLFSNHRLRWLEHVIRMQENRHEKLCIGNRNRSENLHTTWRDTIVRDVQ